MQTEIADGYYAVPDPRNAATMTYWRARSGCLTPWPAKARYEPVLFKVDVPRRLHGPDRRAWVRQWFARNVDPWREAVTAALAAAPDKCRARFAALTTRCAECGRRLTDAKSKVLGMGPECRRGFDEEQLAATLTPAIAAAHAAAVAPPLA